MKNISRGWKAFGARLCLALLLLAGAASSTETEIMNEAESMTRAGFHSSGRKRIDVDPGYSGGKGVLLAAKKRGNFMAFTITMPRLGSYDVQVGFKKLANGGICQFSIDGVDYGPPTDTFASAPSFPVMEMGDAVLTSGNHLFKFTVTGRNPQSTGYWTAVDYIKLLPR